MICLGAVPASTVIPVPFTTYTSSSGASVTCSGLAVTDIEIYKNGSTTQRSSDAGISLLDTDGIDFDETIGLHGFSIDLSDNTDAGFYAVGSWYWVVVSAITVDSQTVTFLAAVFRICAAEAITGKPKVDVDGLLGTAWLTPAVAGTPDVNAKQIGGTAQTAGDVVADTNDIQARLPAALTANGNMKSSLLEIITTALTEGAAGRIAAAWQGFWNVASPVATATSVNQTGDSFARLGAPDGGTFAVDVTLIKKATATQTGTVSSVTSASEFDTDLTPGGADGFADALICFTDGVLVGQCRPLATISVGGHVTVSEAFSASPSIGNAVVVTKSHVHTVAAIQSGLATATNVSNAQTAIIAQVDANETKIDLIQTDVTTLLGRITSTLFSGITSLGNWLRRVSRKDAGTAGMVAAESEINTGGTSTYTGTTDNLEAIKDSSGGSAPSAADVADAVWDEILSDHVVVGSAGAALLAAGSAGDPWATSQPGAYALGTFGYLISTTTPALLQAALTSASAVIPEAAGTIEGFPESLTIGDSYVTALNNFIKVYVRDSLAVPLTGIGTKNFIDADFVAELTVSQGSRTSLVTATCTWVPAVGAVEGYLKVQFTNDQTRRATEGSATMQLVFRWDGGIETTIATQPVEWEQRVTRSLQ